MVLIKSFGLVHQLTFYIFRLHDNFLLILKYAFLSVYILYCADSNSNTQSTTFELDIQQYNKVITYHRKNHYLLVCRDKHENMVHLSVMTSMRIVDCHFLCGLVPSFLYKKAKLCFNTLLVAMEGHLALCFENSYQERLVLRLVIFQQVTRAN